MSVSEAKEWYNTLGGKRMCEKISKKDKHRLAKESGRG